MSSKDLEPIRSAIGSIATAPPEVLKNAQTSKLKRLLGLRRDHFDELNEQGLGLLDKTIFIAYLNCRESGFEQDAQDILHSHLPEDVVRKMTKPKQVLKKDAPRGIDY